MSRDAQGMVKEAKHLRDAIPGIVVKIPVTSEGLAAIKMLKKEGITTLGTAVYSAAQDYWRRWLEPNTLLHTLTA